MSRRAELEAAYRQAVYRVNGDGARFDLHVDRRSGELAALLALHGAQSAAFVTACNPYGCRSSDRANERAQNALRGAVTAAGYHFHPGVGLDPGACWPAEPSLLIIGIGPLRARALARQFGQNALVEAGPDAIPRLVWVAGEDTGARD